MSSDPKIPASRRVANLQERLAALRERIAAVDVSRTSSRTVKGSSPDNLPSASDLARMVFEVLDPQARRRFSDELAQLEVDEAGARELPSWILRKR